MAGKKRVEKKERGGEVQPTVRERRENGKTRGIQIKVEFRWNKANTTGISARRYNKKKSIRLEVAWVVCVSSLEPSGQEGDSSNTLRAIKIEESLSGTYIYLRGAFFAGVSLDRTYYI